MIGIYKITSPSKKVYIGQSINILKRWKSYNQLNCKSQVKLYNSFLKHGVDKHTFEIICECDISELNENERYYQELFNVVGPAGLNCSLVNTKNKKYVHSEETRLIFSKQRTGRKLNPERADKVRLNLEKSRGRKSTPESIEKRRQTIKANGGYKTTEETKEKIRKANTGLKRSDEVKKKISMAMKNRGPFSDEWRRNIGAKSKGRVFSEESKLKISRNSSRNSSKIVLHLETGAYFDSAKDASKCFNFKHSTFKSMLNGSIKTNRTQCIYA